MGKDIILLAEEYCLDCHQGQKRKGGNQEPYSTHPFAVRDNLVKNGHDSPVIQATALLHDSVEDTRLKENKREILKIFGQEVYDGVYILSRNTCGKHAAELAKIYWTLGIPYIDAEGMLTPMAYKLRLLSSRDSIKQIKIADMIHNTSSLPDLSPAGIERKIKDAEEFYIPLGKIVSPIMVKELEQNIANYKNSEHYRKNHKNL